MKRTLLIAATALALSAPAVPHAHATNSMWATGRTGNIVLSNIHTGELALNCQDNSKQYSCVGYISGVFDTLVLMGKICPADTSGSVAAQAVAIAVKYLNNNPEQWAIQPAFLIGNALAPVFPCTQAASQ